MRRLTRFLERMSGPPPEAPASDSAPVGEDGDAQAPRASAPRTEWEFAARGGLDGAEYASVGNSLPTQRA